MFSLKLRCSLTILYFSFIFFLTINLLQLVYIHLIKPFFRDTRCTRQDLHSSTRDRTSTLCMGVQSLNHWSTREASVIHTLILQYILGEKNRKTAHMTKEENTPWNSIHHQCFKMILQHIYGEKIFAVLMSFHYFLYKYIFNQSLWSKASNLICNSTQRK